MVTRSQMLKREADAWAVEVAELEARAARFSKRAEDAPYEDQAALAGRAAEEWERVRVARGHASVAAARMWEYIRQEQGGRLLPSKE